MIEVLGLAFGTFREVEPLNRGFLAGHEKMRITVDTEIRPRVEDLVLHDRLREAFPGLLRHQCRAPHASEPATSSAATIRLLDGDSSANQAHLLEHVMLEILGALDRRSARLSGVTCAYENPPQRNDVFVECADPESGAFAVLIAAEAINAALAGRALEPLYPDAVRSASALRWSDAEVWPASRFAKITGIPKARATRALELLASVHLIEPQPYAMNFSGEPHYRYSGDGERSADGG